MAKYKRAKGRELNYAKLCGRDADVAPTQAPKQRSWFEWYSDTNHEISHSKGLGRTRIAYQKRIAKARNDDFYDNLRVAKGV